MLVGSNKSFRTELQTQNKNIRVTTDRRKLSVAKRGRERGALETNSAFVKTFLQNVINQNEVVIKTIEVKKFEYLPEEYIMPAVNSKFVIPRTNGY